MDFSSFLIIEHAPEHDAGDIISLTKTNTVFGRESLQWKPDIAFNNVYVSRKHFIIYVDSKNHYYIEDLTSKHGTALNGIRLKPNQPKKLNNYDTISFAKDLIVMTFSLKGIEETLELTPLHLTELKRRSLSPQLDPLKQAILFKNTAYSLTDKEYKSMELLLQNNYFVTKEELITYVWSERFTTSTLEPMVSPEEVHALIYRLRKKIPANINIEVIRGKGYSLTMKLDT
ncbi:FHA domain-containing protein [Metabacillus sediminilitoris]|uniref:FHA domain-containing protein n=1 Tax=Metabacillus sediminilitoris TaxID=2567941 RepID=A0A4S4C4A0_9BACI|nr:FHA domain-containing protein [Metabacillus sediminilitoris]QGQ47553.1 FHA domain-containing protein [Metabacillus sediminilitoris]THF81987.1 FHA domain-containing protein [Metabacillus sediminilitoris]